MQCTQRTTDGVGGQETLPLVVMGEQGIGKSSALAMLAQQSRQHDDVLVIVRPMPHAWLCLGLSHCCMVCLTRLTLLVAPMKVCSFGTCLCA